MGRRTNCPAHTELLHFRNRTDFLKRDVKEMVRHLDFAHNVKVAMLLMVPSEDGGVIIVK
jgi:hypothetical protein